MQIFPRGYDMVCPYCGRAIHDEPKIHELREDKVGWWIIEEQNCPACNHLIVFLTEGTPEYDEYDNLASIVSTGRSYLIWPRKSTRHICPKEVPTVLADDYKEAFICCGNGGYRKSMNDYEAEFPQQTHGTIL